MNPSILRAFSSRLLVTFCAISLGLLSGCGSGLGLSGGGSGSTPPPLAATNSPQLGYFWNAADATLRPVLGVPGASQVGQSVVPAGTYATAAASSASGIAILEESDGALDVMTLPTGQPTPLSAKADNGAQIRFSPSGKSAIVFTSGSATVVRITGLPSSPATGTLTASAAIQDAALSDIGSVALAIGNTIQVIGASGAATTLASVGSLGGLAFATGDNLLFADASANTLTLITSASTKPSFALVPTTALLKTPSAIGVSSSGRWALVANSAEASTVRVDLTAQSAPLSIACACSPALVAPIAGTATFRVTAPGTGPLWAVDAAVSAPRSFFIPAFAGSGSAVQQ